MPDEPGTAPPRSGMVALVGWTNVGKSTLLNRLLGRKVAAVADVPQTTRTRITGVLTLEGRGQLVFVDTPGFHRPRHRMNREMVRLARETLGAVDVIAQVIDAARGLGPGDREIAELCGGEGTPRVAVPNKIDRVRPKDRLLPLLEELGTRWGFQEIVPVSALDGDGVDRLVDVLLRLVPEGPPLFPSDYLTDQPERTLAAEWVREKLLRKTRQELPHATAVVIERWAEGDRLIEIDAAIFVERPSQKAIVIGREGGLLKQVGTEARRELEVLLGKKVMLRLWVRVRPDWRNDDRTLRELGLS